PGLAPAAKASVHRNDVAITHLLDRVGRERGAIAAAAVKNERAAEIGDFGLDVALDDAFAEMNGAREVPGRELALLAYVDQVEVLASVEHRFHAVDVHLAHAHACFVDELLETRGMLHFTRGR